MTSGPTTHARRLAVYQALCALPRRDFDRIACLLLGLERVTRARHIARNNRRLRLRHARQATPHA